MLKADEHGDHDPESAPEVNNNPHATITTKPVSVTIISRNVDTPSPQPAKRSARAGAGGDNRSSQRSTPSPPPNVHAYAHEDHPPSGRVSQQQQQASSASASPKAIHQQQHHHSSSSNKPVGAVSGRNKRSNASQQNTNPFQMHSKLSVIPASRKGELNTQYLVTLPGVLKLAEIILGFVSFILAICADRRSTSAAWTEHISFETTIVVTALVIGYVIFPHLTIGNETTRDGLVVVELLFYGTNTLFYFIGIWLMVHLSASWTAEGRGAAIMDAILCVALCVLYAIETFLKFKLWHGDNQHHVAPAKPPHHHHQQHQHHSASGAHEHELSREHSVV
jgi:hypothetical protein